MKTILYVEDNAIVVQAYKGVLTRADRPVLIVPAQEY